MQVGLCYESVLPARGGAEHYISDLARRLARDGHGVHLFACRWDASALPTETIYHQLPSPRGPRFLRPWRFANSCLVALKQTNVDVSLGFDKTFGQDILYPQGGLHSASRANSFLKHPPGITRFFARLFRFVDPTTYSFARLERRQYLSEHKPLIIVNSKMVQRHFAQIIGVNDTRVLYSAIDPERFAAKDREALRNVERQNWGVTANEIVGLFVAMNYRLKGLAPLIRSLAHVPHDKPFRLVVVGGANYARYETLATQLGVRERVLFLGFRADPKEAYFAADFLVHPTFYDPCSLVALEALACGLPVVTSQYNGASELLTPPTDGLVINDPHNANELGAAITTMLDTQQLPARKAAALVTGQRWTFDRHYQELVRIMEEVAQHKTIHN
jgi:UDP-glucose:(heptosyl)LPS alpha-1,3-glucosyltransferase